MHCAPGKENNFRTYKSCYSLDSLVALAASYNKKWMADSAAGVSYPFSLISIRKDPAYLVRELKQRLYPSCADDQACWAEQDFAKRLQDPEISRFTFRPVGPQGRFDWLSTTDINAVMEQYEKADPAFLFLGAVPVDFDDLRILGIRNMSFRDVERKQKKHKLGVVFNTDEHYKPGQHWVCAYVDLERAQIYFFDSVGQKPDRRMTRFLARVSTYLSHEKNIPLERQDICHNPVVHQKGNSECGVYSVHCLVRLLKGESFRAIANRPLSDAEVNKYRKKYFRVRY